MCLFILLLSSYGKHVFAEDICHFEWIKTEIVVPLNGNLYDYIDNYEVKFYINGKESNDFCISKEENASTFSTVLTNVIGEYHVYYLAYNDFYNCYSEQMITFIVKDLTKPDIKGDELVRLLYKQKFDYKEHFTITDNYSEKDKINVYVYDDNVSYDYVGKYKAMIVAVDEDGNKNEKEFYIEIYDDVAPTIKVKKELVFSYGIDFDINDYFDIKDNYDKNVVVTHTPLKKELGNQSLTLLARDQFGNSNQMTFSVNVIDNVPPTIEFLEGDIVLDISKNKSIYSIVQSIIKNISDNYDDRNNITVDYETNIILDKVDVYNVTVYAQDSFNNKNEKTTTVFLKSFENPILICEDKYIFTLGDSIDLESLVSAYDKYDLDINKKIEVVDSNVDETKPGSYQVLYRVFSNSCNYEEKIIDIVIQEKKEKEEVSFIEKAKNFIKQNSLIVFLVIINVTLFLGAIILIASNHKTVTKVKKNDV